MSSSVLKKAVQTLKVGKTSVRHTPDGRISAGDGLQALGLPQSELQSLLEAHGLEYSLYDFGEGREPAFSFAEFAHLAFALDTPEARRWRGKARDLLWRYLSGDVQLAAEIAERSPSAEHRRWLSARLESTESRKRFMSTVAKHGGEGRVYQEVSSLSNQSVLQMSSADFRKRRRVKNTRDGMTAAELLRLSYLETASAKAIEKKGVKGNEQILKLHAKNAEIERRLWEETDHSSDG
ncbi:MAG: DdrC [Meiothermus sp.]